MKSCDQQLLFPAAHRQWTACSWVDLDHCQSCPIKLWLCQSRSCSLQAIQQLLRDSMTVLSKHQHKPELPALLHTLQYNNTTLCTRKGVPRHCIVRRGLEGAQWQALTCKQWQSKSKGRQTTESALTITHQAKRNIEFFSSNTIPLFSNPPSPPNFSPNPCEFLQNPKS